MVCRCHVEYSGQNGDLPTYVLCMQLETGDQYPPYYVIYKYTYVYPSITVTPCAAITAATSLRATIIVRISVFMKED